MSSKDNSPAAKAARKAARKVAKKAAKKAAKKEAKRQAAAAAAGSPPAKKAKIAAAPSSANAEVVAFREKNNLTISGPDSEIAPFLTFAEARKHFPTKCMDACDAQGYVAPTPIQAQTWPALLQKRDMIGIAETGSGKTMAFVLPAAALMLKGDCTRRGRYPRFLCLSPTRELAMQIDQVCQFVGKSCNLANTCIFGGVPKWTQRKALKDGVDFVTGTPGRMKDMLENDCLDLSKVSSSSTPDAVCLSASLPRCVLAGRLAAAAGPFLF